MTALIVAFTACEKDEEKKKEIPSTPQLVAPVNQSFEVADSVTFQWNPSVLVEDDRIEYTLYYSVDSINWTELYKYDKCEFKLKNLTSNQKYYWKVTAVYTLLHSYGTVHNGEVSESEIYTFMTYPDGVRKLKSQYSDQQIQLSWDEAPGTDYVEITFSPAVASINQPIKVPAGTTTLSLSGMENYTKYTFELKQFSTKGYVSKTSTIEEMPLDTKYCVRDGNFNLYTTITIGDQVWLRENLRATKANDGTEIVYEQLVSNAPSSGFYIKGTQSDKYGLYYDSRFVDDDVAKNLCPVGFHISTEDDWKTLERYLGMTDKEILQFDYWANDDWSDVTRGVNNKVGYLLKSSSGWDDFNGISGNGSDYYHLNILPGGWYCEVFDNYKERGIGKEAWFLTSTWKAACYLRGFSYSSHGLVYTQLVPWAPIRCVKDSE